MSPSPRTAADPLTGSAPVGGGAGTSLADALDGVAVAAGLRAVRVLDGVPGPASGWTTLAAALAPGAVERWVATTDAGLAAWRGGRPAPRQVAPTYVLGWVLDALAQAGGTPYGLLRRAPALDLGRVAVRRARPLGQPAAVALVGAGARCLPGDAAAVRAGDRPADDADHLAALLGADLVACARRVEALWAPRVRVGSLQRWGPLADALDSVLASAGAARGDVPGGLRDAARVLALAPEPLGRPARARPDATPGGPGWTRDRRSCCFAHAVDPALVCRTCPRLSAPRAPATAP
ncbi:hypothetical protein [uncultured Pseudokineococcus sp.]|uniref:hypothetical protein n=1 Tax=uncultured Pseudokineococcus sp. TaxID=1642928 RepID=UPI0026130E84|nr:hypothetical protein [uncultured Pseudokineococcus sp.]